MSPPRRRGGLPLGLAASLSVERGGRLLGNADRIALLEAIQATGSMVQAARQVGVSYKTAWERVQDMNNVSAHPLVERTAGGAGGGGTRLTAAGVALVAAFEQVQREHEAMLARLSRTLADPSGALHLLSTLALRTSARNQWAGTVCGVARTAASAEVTLALPGDDRVVASVTPSSVDELGLVIGAPAVALVKASAVTVAPGRGLANRLRAEVIEAPQGDGPAEVTGRLAGGQVVVAMVSAAAAGRALLAPGAAVHFRFAPGAVVIGVV